MLKNPGLILKLNFIIAQLGRIYLMDGREFELKSQN